MIADSPPVRVLVVDDSAFMRTALAQMIGSEPGFQVVGTASSGANALEKIASLDPDVVTLDIDMPGLDGLGALRRIMHECPRPVIMVSAISEKEKEATFNALYAGAFDYVPKQLSPDSLEISHIRSDLIAKLRAAADSRHPLVRHSDRKPPKSSKPDSSALSPTTPAIVAIGTSTGGPRALQQILPRFPADFPVPILIVQHMPPGFTATLARRLDSASSISVREAVHHESIYPGTAYIAPAGLHMRVECRMRAKARISLDPNPEQSLHIPSVDVLFKSVAHEYENRAVGVIMTGMGSDGCEGMQAIWLQGGLTIGQDESTCAVYSMPRACAQAGILSRIVPLSAIPALITQAVRRRKHA